MIKSLASLRFVFAFMVFLHHIDILEDAIGHAFFYTLSGFILSYVYYERFLDQKISRPEFLKLRFSRLYPLYLLTLLVAVPLTLDELGYDPLLWISKFTASLFLFQSFIPEADFYFSFNGLGWSISDLFFFYLLFPVLVLAFNRLSNRMLSFLFLISFVGIILLMPAIPETLQHYFFYINPFLRVFDFAIGILIYRLIRNKEFAVFKKRFTIYEIGCLLLLILFYGCAFLFPKVYRYSVYYWIPMTLFISVFALQKGSISKILSHPVFLFLGELSFGFYLYHQLVLRYAARLLTKFDLDMATWLFNVLCFLVILGVCTISYRFFEMPAKNWLRKRLLA